MTKPEKPKKFTIDIFDLMKHIDRKEYDYFTNTYTVEERTKASFWVVMRYMSTSNGRNDIRNLLFINDIVNRDFSIINKYHPDFIYKLLCVTGTGQVDFHKFLQPPKGLRLAESLAMKFFSEVFGETYNGREIEVLCRKHAKIDQDIIRELAMDLYWDAKDIEKLIIEINSI